jgi:PAS domain S-box-containing protein
MSEESSSTLKSVVELEALAACWLAMEHAETLDEIEGAALSGLVGLTEASIAYIARREDRTWTVSAHIGLGGDIAGFAISESAVPYAEALQSGETICYEHQEEMGADLAKALAAIGLGSLYAVPIMKADTCVGALAIGRPGPSVFNARDCALVRLFTSHLSVLITRRDLVQSLEALAESVPAIVLRTDPSGWINWYNHRWYSFTGQTREEAAGWGWQTAHHPEDFLRVMEEWPRALATGKPIEIEFRLRRYDGAYHWHLARVEPMRDDKGKILSWYGTVVDIEAQKQALERTQRVAETLQEAFLPQQLPQRRALRLDATYVSAEEDARVGGDWYDAFDLPDGRMGVSIGDVTGHGLAASLAVGKLRQAIYTLARRLEDPSEVLAEVNVMLRAQEPGTFATALVAFIAPDGSSFAYATAGHPPPIVAHDAKAPAHALPCDGPPLGVLGSLELTTHTFRTASDMLLLFYTDGITEYGRDAVAGEMKLRSVTSSLVGNSIARPTKFIYEAVLEEKRPQDDIALLLLQFSASKPLPRAPRMGLNKEWRFHASDAQAAHVARREIATHLFETCGPAEEAAKSELIIGELLANTVAHAPGLVHLLLEWTGEHFVLIVRDSGPGLETAVSTLPTDLMEEGRRGLFLIHTLSLDVELAKSPEGGAELRVILPLKPRDQSEFADDSLGVLE